MNSRHAACLLTLLGLGLLQPTSLLATQVTLVQEAPPSPSANAGSPLLVRDVAAKLRDSLPRNFRTSNDGLHDTEKIPSLLGLAQLRASGSAQFTGKGLELLLGRLPAPVVIFDLRQEDHLFINGTPVSWMADRNWANVGKSNEDIRASEAARLHSAGKCLEVFAEDAAKTAGPRSAPERMELGSLQTEEELVREKGASYVRLTVTDHARPTDREVDRFVEAVRALPEGAWIHFHCRAGKGRTTTFLALYDMLRNAHQVSLEDIVERQSLLIGDYNLLKADPDSGWKQGVAKDRAAFVRVFHAYAKANPNGRPLLWSEWLAATH